MDIQMLRWRATGQNKLVPQMEVEFILADSMKPKRIIEDASVAAGKHFYFPDVVTLLTVAERQELFETIVQKLIELRVRRAAMQT
jgi:hypothetical protein